MYKRNCKICNKGFETISQNQINCPEHKGLFSNIYSLINNELHRKCIKCLNIKKINEFYQKNKARCNSWCKICFDKSTYEYQFDRALKRKIKAITDKGGKCSICSYKKNLSALVFHHLDPSKKDMHLDARTMGNNSLNTINKELDKCILLCHNCHSETHNPHLNNLL